MEGQVTLKQVLQVTLPMILEEYKVSVDSVYHPAGSSFLINTAKDLALSLIRYQDGGELDLASIQEMCEYPSPKSDIKIVSCICGQWSITGKLSYPSYDKLYYHCPSCKGKYLWTTMEHRRTSLLTLLEQFTYLLSSEIQAITSKHVEISIPQCEVILAGYIYNKGLNP
jgi:hypothetical protein